MAPVVWGLGTVDGNNQIQRNDVVPRKDGSVGGRVDTACVIVQVSEEHETPRWPLEMYSHDGKATNATLGEGEMIMFECDSIVAGRPFPLVGHSAVVFLAFRMEKERSKLYAGGASGTEGSSKLHTAAAWGDMETAKQVMSDAEERGILLHKTSDINDWQPLHEAARGGHTAMVKLLIEKGVDVHAKTNGGRGTTAHALAKQHLGDKHELVKFFEEMGAEL
mmetsp:Transcript_28725/g.72288  ORF Transcript_28725/g.72288 Transcript_28725/m.72288 type:complete len:221 (-) Transcript_28725:212-874(-)